MTRCAPTTPLADADNNALMGIFGSKPRFADCHDGLSNTLLVIEDAGRMAAYVRGKFYAPPADPIPPGILYNAAWADYNTKVRIDGFSGDGLVQGGGCCVINCNNYDEIYSFHATGAQGLRGDGSVYFVSDRSGVDNLWAIRAGPPIGTNGAMQADAQPGAEKPQPSGIVNADNSGSTDSPHP